MTIISQIKSILPNNVNFAGRGINRLYHRRLNRHSSNHGGIDILEKDWDTLIILDACRLDLFQDEADLNGELSSVRSKGSNTVEFLRGNFAGESLEDTVYLTANPQLYRHEDEINVDFYSVNNIWMEEGWDDEYGTVLPETVTRRAIESHQKYPEKRQIIHYIQPHYPFLSDTKFDKNELNNLNTELAPFWHRLMLDELSLDGDRLYDLFRDNLCQVLPHVQTLIEKIDGKIVVTSDHGNMIGERSYPVPTIEWGHPPGIYTSELVEVPWLEIKQNSRREIQSEASVRSTKQDESEQVKERLQMLGYK